MDSHVHFVLVFLSKFQAVVLEGFVGKAVGVQVVIFVQFVLEHYEHCNIIEEHPDEIGTKCIPILNIEIKPSIILLSKHIIIIHPLDNITSQRCREMQDSTSDSIQTM